MNKSEQNPCAGNSFSFFNDKFAIILTRHINKTNCSKVTENYAGEIVSFSFRGKK